MQDFIEECFPSDISYGMSGGPRYCTEVVTSNSGKEYRNINLFTGRNRYNVAHGVRTKEQLDRLVNFFRSVRGKAIGFRFKDWLDYQVIGQEIAIADGERSQFQLIKTYQVATMQEIRKITKPVADTLTIYLDDTPFTGAHVDSSTGIITFRYPPKKGVKIKADFEFDVPVRFDVDHISAMLEGYGVHSVHDIALIEIYVDTTASIMEA